MCPLVIHPMKLGDLAQATPLLQDLRDPREPLILVATKPEVAAAATITGLPDETSCCPKKNFFPAPSGPTPSKR